MVITHTFRYSISVFAPIMHRSCSDLRRSCSARQIIRISAIANVRHHQQSCSDLRRYCGDRHRFSSDHAAIRTSSKGPITLPCFKVPWGGGCACRVPSSERLRMVYIGPSGECLRMCNVVHCRRLRSRSEWRQCPLSWHVVGSSGEGAGRWFL